MSELWKQRQADGTMTWAAYRGLGGVEGAVAARADAILDERYTAEQQAALRQVLLRLVQPGEGAADTRRRVRLDDLVPAGELPDTLYALLKPLIDERLLTSGRDSASDAETLEVSHEALIRAWPTLGQWISEARAEEQAAASRRPRQQALFLVGSLIVALVAAMAAGWFGVAAQRSATSEQEQKATAVAASQRAEREATVALARQPLAQAGRDASGQPDRALLFSMEANTLTDEAQARSSLLSVLVTNEQLAGLIRGHTAGVYSVAFSPDRKTLASASENRTVQQWDVSLDSWIARACQIAGRNLTQDEWNQFISPDRPYHRTCPESPPGEGAPANAP